MFKKGKPKTGGRKKGVLNKYTSVRQLLDDALERNKEHVNKILDDWCKDPAKIDYVLSLKSQFEPKTMPVAGSSTAGGSFVAQITPIDIEERIKQAISEGK